MKNTVNDGNNNTSHSETITNNTDKNIHNTDNNINNPDHKTRTCGRSRAEYPTEIRRAVRR